MYTIRGIFPIDLAFDEVTDLILEVSLGKGFYVERNADL